MFFVLIGMYTCSFISPVYILCVRLLYVAVYLSLTPLIPHHFRTFPLCTSQSCVRHSWDAPCLLL